MSEERPSPIPKVIRRWWSLPVFAALIVWEFYSADKAGIAPNYIWLGIAGVGLLFLFIVNLGGMRR